MKLAEQADYILMFAGIKSHASVIAIDPIYPVIKSLEIANNMFYAAYRKQVKKLLWLSSCTSYPLSKNKLQESDMFKGNPPDHWYPVGWMTRYLESQCKMYSEKLKNPTQSTPVAQIEFWSSYAVRKRYSGRVPGPAAGTRISRRLQAAPRFGRARTVRLKMHFVPNPSNSAA